ncbi:hypothetical protein [Thermocladium modestius]|uniref:hypothetical protein n=1 Tax=Thermocladium modestius TaxID=62609 RepID=UPI00166889FA|nr:hypothetical protein [Thermocladium modestius]
MQQQLANMVTEYVYRRITIEYDNPELGKLAVAIVNTLLSKDEAMPDEKIASTLGVNAIEVRRVLHLLNGVGLVVKGKETMEYGGMQEIRWSINYESMNKFIKWVIKETRGKLEQVVKSLHDSSFYVCPMCFRRYPDSEASQHGFTCLVDGSALEMVNADAEIPALLNVIERLRRLEEMSNA